MHYRHEIWFALVCFLAGLCFMGCLIWGIVSSSRMGVPSVSRTQADNLALRACYFVLLFLFGKCRWTADIKQLKQFPSLLKTNVLVIVTGIMQILFLQLVCIVTLDYDQNDHYLVASTAIGFGVLRESIMFWRRACWPPKKWTCKMILRAFEMFLNLLIILLLIALCLAYAILISLNEHDFEALDVCLLEYSIFYVTFYLVVFQIGDFNPTDCQQQK